MEKTVDGVEYHTVPEASQSCTGCVAHRTDLCNSLIVRGENYEICKGGIWAAKQGVPVDTKPSNPKQAAGESRPPLHLIPTSALLYESAAFAEGAGKYGQANWRIAGVSVMTYAHAALRHIGKYVNGERVDPKTLVHHLGNARACLGIILDAETSGMLTDDRPPAQDLSGVTAEVEATLAHLKELHKDLSPRHYVHGDTP